MKWFTIFVCAFISTNASGQSVTESMRSLLKVGTSGVEWSSIKHAHEYSDSGLHLLVRRIIDDLLLDQKKFDKEISFLTETERKQLAFDSIDSRTDLIDLLSIELKFRLISRIEELPIRYSLDSSEVWSIAKYRLKSVLEPHIKRSTGVIVFREPGLQSQEVLFVCGDARTADETSIGGIQISQRRLKSRIKVRCGDRHFTLESAPSGSSIASPNTEWNLPQTQDSKTFYVTGMIGLSATIAPFMQKLTSSYIEWLGGYKLTAQEEGSLKAFATEAIISSDLLLLAVNLPDGNRFELSNQAEWGQRLTFVRELPTTKIVFQILIPPLRSEASREKVRSESGVSFSFDELATLIEKRAQPFQLIDLTCFSSKHLKDWLEVSIARSKKSPWLVGSKRGQQAEGTLDILPQLDLMFYLLDSVAQSQHAETKILLDRGSPRYRWLSHFGRQTEFLPFTHLETSVIEALTNPTRTIVWLREETNEKKTYRFNPSSQ